MIFSLKNKRKKLKELSDEALISLYQKNKGQDYFGEIYNRYSHLVYGTCLKYLKDAAAAHDVTMDIFELLMEKIPKQNDIRSFGAWLYQITRNECFRHLRKAKKMPIDSLDEEFSEKSTENFMENNDILHRIDEQTTPSLEATISKAIQQLKLEQKACVTAFFLEEKSYKEIAEELGYPMAKVKSYIQNGKRNLKNILKQHVE